MTNRYPFQKFRIILRGLNNMYLSRKPLCVSFEVTHSCTCNCRHCDKGGLKKEVKLMGPEDYKRRIKELRPAVIQISGGEPLVREDIHDVIRALRGNSALPYIVFVTNASLLDEEKFLSLKEAGVNRFSISMDFPDERHDEFRRHKGLFKHLSELVPYLAKKYNPEDIAMNCALTKVNFRCALDVAKKATEWGVLISFSAYSKLRTGDEDLCITEEEELKELKEQIDALIDFKKRTRPKKTVINAESTLRNTFDFFKNGGIPGCLAGERFLIVRPDGDLNACSMFPEKIYQTQQEVIDKFTIRKECTDCYVAIRAYSGKTIPTMIKEMVRL